MVYEGSATRLMRKESWGGVQIIRHSLVIGERLAEANPPRRAIQAIGRYIERGETFYGRFSPPSHKAAASIFDRRPEPRSGIAV